LNLVDIIIIGIVLIGFILGFKDGFVRKLIGFSGFVLAVYLSIVFASELGKVFENVLGIEFYLSEIIAGGVIFIGIMVLFSVLKRIVHPFDKVNNLLNQILGGAVGMIQILFFLSAALYILKVFNVPGEKARQESVVYQPVYNIIPGAINLLSDYTPDAKKRIKDYINDKDTLND
jgi:membrane protein required for colicin V production